MRLNCPGCGAQYEVEDTAIPDEGRDVQCSACGHGWFQYVPVTGKAFGAPEPFGAKPAPPPRKPEPPERPQAPPVEVARPEARPETPRPAALDDIREFLRQEAQQETEQRRKEGVTPPPPPKPKPEPQPAPDPAAVGSSLRPAPVAKGQGKPGFGIGFFATVVLFLLVAGIYVSAPRLAEALPELRAPLAGYVAFVDQGREALGRFAAKVAFALQS